jgi:hypothetical protein
MFVPWQTQAWGRLAQATRLRKYAQFAYDMTDLIAGSIIEPEQTPFPVYAGAFDVYNDGRGGVSSAVYLEGVIEAVRTAEALGDKDRAARYRAIVPDAARFVVQLMFKEEEAYYIRSPRDVLDGVRNSPIHPTLRIDNMQHAMAALLGAADVLKNDQRK